MAPKLAVMNRLLRKTELKENSVHSLPRTSTRCWANFAGAWQSIATCGGCLASTTPRLLRSGDRRASEATTCVQALSDHKAAGRDSVEKKRAVCYYAAVENVTSMVRLLKDFVLAKLRYRTQLKRIGELDCTVVSTDQPPAAIGILCHGFGAPGDDLVGLAPDLLQARAGSEPVELIFPSGLLSLADEGFPEGRAWWRLSIQRLLSIMEQGQYELIRQESPPGIEAAQSALSHVVEEALARTGLPSRQLLLGGFSQGAMVAMECACCAMPAAPGAMALFSGCLIREKQWRAGVNKLAGTKILQSHGELDPILPLRTGVWLRDMLIESGCHVDFRQFVGPHTICWEAIEGTAGLLDDLANPTS